MRKMKKVLSNGEEIEINVVEHVILRNFWEYYITDDHHNSDIVRAFVMGFENELGDISLSEIRPYAISRTKNLKEVAPAQGWKWAS